MVEGQDSDNIKIHQSSHNIDSRDIAKIEDVYQNDTDYQKEVYIEPVSPDVIFNTEKKPVKIDKVSCESRTNVDM